ncbi:putative reverse transcriptase domain-containing protein, partial [Tanacetum coccineum]
SEFLFVEIALKRGVMPLLGQCLKFGSEDKQLLEAARCLTNIAGGKSEETRAFLPILPLLIAHIGGVKGDYYKYHDDSAFNQREGSTPTGTYCTFGFLWEHAVHYKELSGFKYRHDMVRDVLFDICTHAGISAKKEAPVNFLTDLSDGRSTLRLANVLVFGWVGGKHACVDLTRVFPLVGLSNRGLTVGQAALKAASCKVTKHEKTCIENQHVFIPLAFDTFGFLAPEAVELLNRVQWVMNSNVMMPRSTNVVFHRISFAIPKELAAQFIARLPSTTM